jgi:RNA polymerase sigma-70 factor (ECF subfamily)
MTGAPGTELPLEERFRNGEAASFDEAVTLYRKDLYATAYRILGTHEEADEAAQEAFLRAWRSMTRFRGDASLKTWLVRIVINVSKSILARKKEATPLSPEIELPDRSEGSEEKAIRRQTGERVRNAVRTLPPRQREVVWMKVFSELKYRDVAAAMGLSEGAVKAHLHQAVANLRRRMGAADEREA